MTCESELMYWVRSSKDTNEFCERNLIVDAVHALDENPPDVGRAQSRLLQVIIGESQFVNPPEFAIEMEQETELELDLELALGLEKKQEIKSKLRNERR